MDISLVLSGGGARGYIHIGVIEELKKQVKAQIESEELSRLYNDKLKPVLLEKFVNELEFDPPEFVVEQEIDMALNKKASSMSEDEI